jgi:hypothetical protein
MARRAGETAAAIWALVVAHALAAEAQFGLGARGEPTAVTLFAEECCDAGVDGLRVGDRSDVMPRGGSASS